MANRKFLGVFLFLLLPAFIFAGYTGKITGKIVDTETGVALPGTNVVVEGTHYGAASNVEGTFLITNIPAGTYTLVVSMIGYKTVVIKNVKVSVDLTTRQDFELVPTVIEGEEVVVEAIRPLIQKDVRASRTIQSGDDMNRMPIDSYEGALITIAGAVFEGGDLHFRGGRGSEVTYLLDNTSMVDPLSGNNDSEISNFAIEETHVMTGGFSAEYGNAQSGVVNVVTKDGRNIFSGNIRYTTSDNRLGSKWSSVRADEVPENRNRVEFSLSGPDPILTKLLPGRLNYIITGDFLNTQGRFLNQDRISSTFLGKLTYRPIPQLTIRLNGLITDSKYDVFSNLWKNTVYEDKQVKYAFRDDDGDGINDNRNYIEGWYDNGMLDTEDLGIDIGNGEIFGAGNGRLDFIDINGNGEWDPGEPTEDVNGNGVFDSEDLDHNGKIDKFNILDHLSARDLRTNQFGLYLMHQLSERTFYEIKFHRYYTRQFRNAKEIINEDIDGDGKLDMEDEWIQTSGGEYQWVDSDGDGYFDRGGEDLNGNGVFDDYVTDLFTDEDRHG